MPVSTSTPALRSQDLAVALKLAVVRRRDIDLTGLAGEMGMALSSLHGAVRRAEQARLVSRADGSLRARMAAVLEFAVHGARYAYAGQLGPTTRGMPTSVGGPVLRPHFAAMGEIPVWPDPQGTVRGPGLAPLFAGACAASGRDEDFYAVLTLVDALRIGAARERAIATRELQQRLAA